MRVTLLHTNDIHGRVEGLARIATLVERIRAQTDHRVIYVDAGDVEEKTVQLSNLTKGAAMHRLLSAAGCEAAAVGNAVWLLYGPQALAAEARAAGYPLLLANLVPVEGVQATALIDGVGFVGVTDPFRRLLNRGIGHGVEVIDEVDAVRRGARELRAKGATAVVCLSHLGYRTLPEAEGLVTPDPELATQVEGEVDVIVGAHSHDLLPDGERIGSVLVAQAGAFAEYLGRIDIVDGEMHASVIEVTDDIPQNPAVLAAAAAAEADLDAFLDLEIAELEAPLDCRWIVEMLRTRMNADVGLGIAAVLLDRPLPPGRLRRRELWEACPSSANPAAAGVTGVQLAQMLERGRDPEFEKLSNNALRGRARGRLYAAGAEKIEPEQTYVVAATDFEFWDQAGLVDADWDLNVSYEFPTILREAIEEQLAVEAQTMRGS